MIIADTGFFVALVLKSDRHHASAVTAAKRYAEHGLVTTWPVLTETTHLIQRAAGQDVAQRFLCSIEAGAAQLFELTAAHLPRLCALMEKYRDLPMDLPRDSLEVTAPR